VVHNLHVIARQPSTILRSCGHRRSRGGPGARLRKQADVWRVSL
jgi:hypothetical protein